MLKRCVAMAVRSVGRKETFNRLCNEYDCLMKNYSAEKVNRVLKEIKQFERDCPEYRGRLHKRVIPDDDGMGGIVTDCMLCWMFR